MIRKIFGWRQTRELSSFDGALPQEQSIQQGRLAFIGDEEPRLLDHIRRAQFSVGHDKTGDDLKNYDAQLHDVAIVDYCGVGKHLGEGVGLDT